MVRLLMPSYTLLGGLELSWKRQKHLLELLYGLLCSLGFVPASGARRLGFVQTSGLDEVYYIYILREREGVGDNGLPHNDIHVGKERKIHYNKFGLQ